jgi:hypothetical protein
MTLPASGTITWQQICAEFGLDPSTAVWPASFYGKGGAPASGSLSFANFYGRSGTPGSFTPPPGSYTYWDNGTSTGLPGASVTVTSLTGAVTWTYTTSGSGALTASLVSGGSGASITFNLPSAAGSVDRNATVTLNVGGSAWTLTLRATGEDAGGGGDV